MTRPLRALSDFAALPWLYTYGGEPGTHERRVPVAPPRQPDSGRRRPPSLDWERTARGQCSRRLPVLSLEAMGGPERSATLNAPAGAGGWAVGESPAGAGGWAVGCGRVATGGVNAARRTLFRSS